MILFRESVWCWHEWAVVSIREVWSKEPGFLGRVIWDWSHEGGVLRFILKAISAVASSASVVCFLHGEKVLTHISVL